MKKLTILSAFVLLLLLAGAPRAHAQTAINLGVRGSYEVDNVQAPAIGAGLRIGTIALPIVINPTFDYYFIEDGDVFGFEDAIDVSYMQFTLNALYEFGYDNQVFTPYAGPGLSVVRRSVEDGSSTELGLNLVGGARFGLGALTPFVQAQFTVGGDYEPASISAGLLFSLSR